MMSPAGGEHGWIASRLDRLLGVYVDDHKLGAVFAAETGFRISTNPDTVRAPDVAFVRQDQMDKLDNLKTYLPLAPDLVAEVLSPNDSSSEVEAKAQMWLNAGSQMVLVVDPENSSIRVYRDPSNIEVLHERDILDASDVVDGWKLNVGDVFPAK